MSPLNSISALIAFSAVDLPDGLEPGAIELTFSSPGQADVVQTIALADLPADRKVVFAPPVAGDWTGSVCRLAVTGERISAPVVSTINVPAPNPDQPPAQKMDVPSSITLTLA